MAPAHLAETQPDTPGRDAGLDDLGVHTDPHTAAGGRYGVKSSVRPHLVPGPNGYEIAPGVFIAADKVSTWTCPNCGAAHIGTLGEVVDKMWVVVVKTTNEERDTWHGCINCKDQAPQLDGPRIDLGPVRLLTNPSEAIVASYKPIQQRIEGLEAKARYYLGLLDQALAVSRMRHTPDPWPEANALTSEIAEAVRQAREQGW